MEDKDRLWGMVMVIVILVTLGLGSLFLGSWYALNQALSHFP